MPRRIALILITALVLLVFLPVVIATRVEKTRATVEPRGKDAHLNLRRRPATSLSTSSSSPKRPNFCFVTAYRGLFAQEEEDGSGDKQAQFGFGAKRPWKELLSLADGDDLSSPCPDCFVVFAVRHGHAISNAVEQFVGEQAWNGGVGQRCSWEGALPDENDFGGDGGGKYNNKAWPLFDSPLSDRGRKQASALGALLSAGGWAKTIVDGEGGGEGEGDNGVVVIASPLSRTLDTALLALGPSFLEKNSTITTKTRFHVSEWARETVGVNTCDARRGVSSSSSSSSSPLQRRRRHHHHPCDFDKGLRELYNSSSPSPGTGHHHHHRRHDSMLFDGFPVVGRKGAPWSPEASEEERERRRRHLSSRKNSHLRPGLFSADDSLWDPETRESDDSVKERTQILLELATALARGEEKRPRRTKRVFVVAHSGWIRNLLDGVGRRSYVPDNAELVPLVVQRREGAECGVTMSEEGAKKKSL